MLRAASASPRYISPFKQQSLIVSSAKPAALCSGNRFYSTEKGSSVQTPLSKPLGTEPEPNPESQPNKDATLSGVVMKLGLAGLVLGTCGYLVFTEDGRLMTVEKFPQMQNVFDAANLSTQQKSMKPAPSLKQFQSAAEDAPKVKLKTMSASAAAGDSTTETKQTQPSTVQQIMSQSKPTDRNHNTSNRQGSAGSNDEDLSGVIGLANDSVKFLFSGQPTTGEVEARKRKAQEAETSRAEAAREREEAKRRAANEQKELAAAEYLRMSKEKKMEVEKINQINDQADQANLSVENKLSYLSSQIVEDTSKASRQMRLAIEASREHGNILKLALEANKDELARPHWEKLRAAGDLVNLRSNDAEKSIKDLRTRIKEFTQLVDSARKNPLTAKNPALHKYQAQAKALHLQLESFVCKLDQSQKVDETLEHYYQLYMKDRVRFHRELQTTLPDADCLPDDESSNEIQLKELLALAHRRLFRLREDIHAFKVLSEQRFLDASIEQGNNDLDGNSKLLKKKLAEQKEQIAAQTQLALKCDVELKEKELSESLAAQNLELTKRTRDTLDCHERQMMKEFEEQTEGALQQEREYYLSPVKEHAEKLERLASALKDKVDVKASVEKVRNLVCVTRQFNAELNGMDKDIEEKIAFLPTYNRLRALSKSDTFVKSVVDSIPDEVVENGVSSETALKIRFMKMYEELQGVAKCSEDSSPFMQFIYKYLRWFQVEPAQPKITKFENINPESAPSNLLRQARYFIERDSLDSAVQCVVLVDGAAKLLVKDWIHQARLYLETKQAAKALHWYATACYMGHIV